MPPTKINSFEIFLAERAHLSSIEICGICQCNVGSKVIVFAASAIFEIIPLKTAGKYWGLQNLCTMKSKKLKPSSIDRVLLEATRLL